MRAQHAAIEQALGELDADPAVLLKRVGEVLDFASNLERLRKRLDDKSQSRMLRTVFRRITLDEGRIVGYDLHSPFDRLLTDTAVPGASRPDLEEGQVTPTIRSILEFDTSRLAGFSPPAQPTASLIDSVDPTPIRPATE